MSNYIICKNCGRRVAIEDGFDIQFCECGVYYRKSRDFTNRWVKAGFWKGGKSEKEAERQRERSLGRKKK